MSEEGITNYEWHTVQILKAIRDAMITKADMSAHDQQLIAALREGQDHLRDAGYRLAAKLETELDTTKELLTKVVKQFEGLDEGGIPYELYAKIRDYLEPPPGGVAAGGPRCSVCQDRPCIHDGPKP